MKNKIEGESELYEYLFKNRDNPEIKKALKLCGIKLISSIKKKKKRRTSKKFKKKKKPKKKKKKSTRKLKRRFSGKSSKVISTKTKLKLHNFGSSNWRDNWWKKKKSTKSFKRKFGSHFGKGKLKGRKFGWQDPVHIWWQPKPIKPQLSTNNNSNNSNNNSNSSNNNSNNEINLKKHLKQKNQKQKKNKRKRKRKQN